MIYLKFFLNLHHFYNESDKEEEIRSTPQWSSSCSNGQTDMRQINRRKKTKFNYLCTEAQ